MIWPAAITVTAFGIVWWLTRPPRKPYFATEAEGLLNCAAYLVAACLGLSAWLAWALLR